jgi:hypothetical protein
MMFRATTQLYRIGVCLCAAAAAVLFTIPAPAQHKESKFTREQIEGYLGGLSRSEYARSVFQRLKARTIARRIADTTDRVAFWHEVALDSVALDHTPDPDTGEVAFIQGGPTRTSRAMAMVQIAVYDAVNAFGGFFQPYNDIGSENRFDTSVDAAIAWAAYTVLVALFPDQTERFDSLLQTDLEQVDTRLSPGVRKIRLRQGREVGERAAQAILDARANDRSNDPEPRFGEGGRVADGATTVFDEGVNDGSRLPFRWEPDPNTPEFSGDFNLSLGAYWGGVTPFALEHGGQFRITAPPEPGSQDYVEAFNEVASAGGSPFNTGIPSTSTEEKRFIGNFWGYDAVPLLGTPPRLYNQIAIQLAHEKGIKTPIGLARFLAIVNVGLADSGIAAWDSKYFYNYWRPVTAIRRDDGIDGTPEDPHWDPVGISVVNVELPGAFIRPTPPFPAYPSGHATFGASMFEVLRSFFGDDTAFTFISDEYNGEGIDPADPTVPRPLVPVRFSSFTEAQEQNGQSRIYNGVHWQYDNQNGQALGVRISRYILDSFQPFQPVKTLFSSDLEESL